MYVAVKGTPSASRSTREVLEVDLFLEVLRAGRDEDALAAEDGGDEIGERLAGAGAGFGEQHAAVLERAGDRVGHLDAGRRAALEVGQRLRQRAGVGDRRRREARSAVDLRDVRGQASGYSGNFRHSVSTSAFTMRERAHRRRASPARAR